MSKEISVRLSESEIKEAFKQHFTGPHKDLFSDAVYELIGSDDWKLERLFKAAIGIIPKQLYGIGTKILVPTDHANGYISTYKWDMERMESEGLIVDNRVEVTVMHYNPWEFSPYKVGLKAYKQDTEGDEMVLVSERIKGENCFLSEEYPEFFTDKPHVNIEAKDTEEDDLPF